MNILIGLLSILTTVGLTGDQTPIEAVEAGTRGPVVLLIGGLDGGAASAAAVRRAIKRAPRRLHVYAIPLANPKRVQLKFPPEGVAYRDSAESHYLWRWIGVLAPDLVLIEGPDAGLVEALDKYPVAGLGRIPTRAGTLNSVKLPLVKSEARMELERRAARTPRQVADELAVHYGHDLNPPVYIPALAVIGRLRLGDLENAKRLAEPYANGSVDSLAKPSGSHLAGHLLFAELAERTGDPRYAGLVRRAADLAFTPAGEMKEAMPMNDEMSDAVFMGCPILAKAGKLTGETKYFDMALRHLRYMQKLCLRKDGLYRHSPLTEAAWGRGNAFPALGLALALSSIPKDHSAFAGMLASYRSHMASLAQFQDKGGMWRQVIDLPGAYPEFSATAMIGAAMLRGVRSGWLDAREFRPRVDRAWRAISGRISSDGRLIDVCESTGKQKSLTDYLRRAAILDRDPRGGAMALLFATEMAGLP